MQVVEDDPPEHEQAGKKVSDERPAIDRPALRREDGGDRKPDQETPAQQGQRRGMLDSSDQENRRRDGDLEQLQQRGGAQELVGDSLREVGDDVVGVLEPDRHADGPLTDPQLGQLRR